MSESTLRAIAGAAAHAGDGSHAFKLDRDPFLDSGLPDPLERRLDELERRTPPVLRPVRREPKPGARSEPRRRALPPRTSATPALSEIELGDERGLFDRLLPERARRALASIPHPVEGES